LVHFSGFGIMHQEKSGSPASEDKNEIVSLIFTLLQKLFRVAGGLLLRKLRKAFPVWHQR
jgi:hypothetical protein